MKTWIKWGIATLALALIGGTVYYFAYANDKLFAKFYIPEKAFLVYKIKAQELAQKLDIEELKKSNIFREWLGTKKEPSEEVVARLLQQIINHPEKSGINFKEPVIGYTEIDPRGSFNGLIITLKDHDKWGKMAMNNANAGTSSGTEDGVSFIKLSTTRWIAWNKEVAFFGNIEADARNYLIKILKNRQNNVNSLINNTLRSEKDFSFGIRTKFIEKEMYDSKEYEKWISYMKILASGSPSENSSDMDLYGSFEFPKGSVEIELMAETDKSDKTLPSIYKESGNPARMLALTGPPEDIISLGYAHFDMAQLIPILKNASINFVDLIGTRSNDDDYPLMDETNSKSNSNAENEAFLKMLTGEVSFVVYDHSKNEKSNPSIESTLRLGHKGKVEEMKKLLFENEEDWNPISGYIIDNGYYLTIGNDYIAITTSKNLFEDLKTNKKWNEADFKDNKALAVSSTLPLLLSFNLNKARNFIPSLGNPFLSSRYRNSISGFDYTFQKGHTHIRLNLFNPDLNFLQLFLNLLNEETKPEIENRPSTINPI